MTHIRLKTHELKLLLVSVGNKLGLKSSLPLPIPFLPMTKGQSQVAVHRTGSSSIYELVRVKQLFS